MPAGRFLVLVQAKEKADKEAAAAAEAANALPPLTQRYERHSGKLRFTVMQMPKSMPKSNVKVNANAKVKS